MINLDEFKVTCLLRNLKGLFVWTFINMIDNHNIKRHKILNQEVPISRILSYKGLQKFTGINMAQSQKKIIKAYRRSSSV